MLKLKKIIRFYPCILFLISLFFIIFYSSTMAQPFVDVGRELIIAQGILEGKTLYKDIFNFYGAIPYFIFALFSKIFGLKLSSYFFFNSINALLVIFGIYALINQFLNKAKSLILTISILSICVFDVTLFALIYPYSICYTFSFCAFLYSVLFLIKYFKFNSDKYLYFSIFLAGFSFASKNEFILLPVLILGILLFYKKLNIKRFIFSVLIFSIFPLIQLILLYLNGLRLYDVSNVLNYIISCIKSPAMHSYHQLIGMYPIIKIRNLIAFIFILFFFGCNKILSTNSKVNKIVSYSLIFTVFLIASCSGYAKKMFFCLPLFMLVILILNFKKISNTPKYLILFLFGLFISIKNFFSLDFALGNGNFAAIILFICFFVYIYKINDKNKILNFSKNTFLILFFIFSFTLSATNLILKKYAYSFNIISNDNKIETGEQTALTYNAIVDFINKNTNKEDKILVFPEGEIVNFLTERKIDYFLYSLHDIILLGLGEENVAQKIKKSDIKYIVDISEFKYNGTLLAKSSNKFISNYLLDKYKLLKVEEIIWAGKANKIYIYAKK